MRMYIDFEDSDPVYTFRRAPESVFMFRGVALRT
nr:hypothetical protein [Vibrio parahaemolyticus]